MHRFYHRLLGDVHMRRASAVNQADLFLLYLEAVPGPIYSEFEKHIQSISVVKLSLRNSESSHLKQETFL